MKGSWHSFSCYLCIINLGITCCTHIFICVYGYNYCVTKMFFTDMVHWTYQERISVDKRRSCAPGPTQFIQHLTVDLAMLWSGLNWKSLYICIHVCTYILLTIFLFFNNCYFSKSIQSDLSLQLYQGASNFIPRSSSSKLLNATNW